MVLIKRFLAVTLFVVTAVMTCFAQTPATPTFSPAAGSYTTTTMVTISDTTPGVSIYYTTDGSTPTTSSTLYTGPIFVAATSTVKAIANGYSITVMPANRTINIGDQLQFTATDNLGKDITNLGSTTWETSDSSIASLQGQGLATGVSTGQVTISASTTTTGTPSSVGSATYTITTTGRVFTPYTTPSSGNYYTAQSVALASSAGATIYYTTDGSQPTTGSSVYSSPITVSSTTTIKAIATKSGMLQSNTGTSVFTIFPQGTIMPAANVSGIMF